ncbi:DNA topoisomerase 3-beta-1 isoform X2 [Copidosoma floridanum]|uniref:DNA topoisomerase 3-beta-1 isoform X2 n=1 Tax=Copidosoma floridanum TaxID=29053 RepID=UPI000C6FBBBE|nr:DNA topoisomerase 3-beta-1 isoform X2 [Copidosoma floridanum]
MKTAFMVAEKPSLAASLANILSNGRCTTRKGSNGSCSVHEWMGQFRGENVNFKMTSVCGHVMSLDFIGKYNNWDKVDPVKLFTCPTEKKEAVPKLKIPNFLLKEGGNCDYLILWLDCDKEGENICFEVIQAVQQGNRRLNPDDIWRAKFSAITDKDIKAAMANLAKPNENEAKSVDARQELDLRIGCAFTRFQTKFFQGKYGDLDASLISYGPCQTPTLGFCVQRHDEIQTFKPDPYWVLQSSDGLDIVLSWSRVRSFDKEVANIFLSIVKEFDQATVLSIQSTEKSKSRPIALNTVELMRVASSGLGMGPHHAMQIAERLYTQGYISYPRTETTSYPENFDLLSTLRQQQNSSDWGDEVRKVLSNGINKPKKGHDAGDHPPITPMKSASRNELDGDSWRLYDYITRHFIATVSRDCKYLSTTISIEIGSEIFTVTGHSLIDPGYTSLLTWQALSNNESIPRFQIGEKVKIVEAKLNECFTQPPDYLTESELITLMEKHGIGTDASIPVHINNICIRNYVNVASGRKLVPTSLGIVLVHGYQKIDPELVLPTMRSAVEEQLNLIAVGRVDFHPVLQHTVEIFKQKFHYFVQSIDAMDQLFEVSFSPLSASGKSHSRCGKCRRYMKYIQTKPSRLHCAHCNETYNLPQNGNIRIYKELKCPLDDFELLSWSTGTRGKSYTFCPYCFNNPPFRDMKKGSTGCNACTHPTCPHGLNSNGLSSCLECDSGILVLDPSAAPKWKLVCNKCDVIIHLFEGAHKVMVLADDVCDCGAQLVTVEYKQDKSKLPNEETEMTGCVFCTPAFTSLVEKHRAVASKPVATRGRGHAKSRSRGKPRPPKDKMAQLAAYFV